MAGENQSPAPPSAISQIHNEQTKLLATAPNTAATSCFTVGVATPIAGYIYNVSNLQASLSFGTLIAGGLAWLATAAVPHVIARRILRRLRP